MEGCVLPIFHILYPTSYPPPAIRSCNVRIT